MLTTATHHVSMHASAPSLAAALRDISVSRRAIMADRYGQGVQAVTAELIPAVGCVNPRTEAANGWLHTPKFGTTHHSQRGRSAA